MYLYLQGISASKQFSSGQASRSTAPYCQNAGHYAADITIT